MKTQSAYMEQLDTEDATWTVRCDLPRANDIDSMVTVPTHKLPEALSALSGLCVEVAVWGQAPIIIEVRRTS